MKVIVEYNKPVRETFDIPDKFDTGHDWSNRQNYDDDLAQSIMEYVREEILQFWCEPDIYTIDNDPIFQW
jgi:hypothetical protein